MKFLSEKKNIEFAWKMREHILWPFILNYVSIHFEFWNL